MHNGGLSRWWLAGAAAIALVLGWVLPQRGVHVTPAAGPMTAAEATVPPQLLGESGIALASPSPQPSHLAVYVCGAVHKPGVYELSPNTRVADGIARAGGPLPDADLEQLNLAEPLSDAMKIAVPKKGEHLDTSPISAADSLSDSGSSSRRHRSGQHGASRSSHKLQPGQTLNVNTASESELTSLPGVGPGLARRIAEYRSANGRFQTVDDLQNVSGIGPSKFARVAPFIRL